MKNFLLKNRKALIVLFGNLFFLCILLFLLNSHTSLFVDKFINANGLIISAIIFLFILVFIFTLNQKNNKKILIFSEYSLLFLAVLIIAPSIRFNLIENISLLEPIYKILPSNTLILSTLFFCLSLLVLYLKKSEYEAKKDIFFNGKINIILVIILIFSFIIYTHGINGYGFQMDEMYHTQIVKNYIKTGVVDFSNYDRSKITSFIGIFSYLLFSKFNLNEEFIFRFPIVCLGIINILLVYLISEKVSNKKTAIIATLYMGTETYLMYLAKYFRFYTPSISLILLLLYINIKYNNGYIKITTIITSFVGYLYFESFFLPITGIFLFVYLVELLKNKKCNFKNLIFYSTALLFFVFSSYSLLKKALSSNETYNAISWKYNLSNATHYFNYLVYNYNIIFLISILGVLAGIINIFKKNNSREKYFTEILLFLLLLFIFGYMLNVPFNFTYRPLSFVIPLMVILWAKYSFKIFDKNKIYFLLVLILVVTNAYYSIIYNLNSPGDKYYPTKIVYEKLDIVAGNKDLAEFINRDLKDKENEQNFAIIYIGQGLNHLDYYLEPKYQKLKKYEFKYSANGDGDLENLKTISSSTNDAYIIINANAYSGRINYLYDIFQNRKYVTEADQSLAKYIESENYNLAYKSADGYSKIYIKINKTAY